MEVNVDFQTADVEALAKKKWYTVKSHGHIRKKRWVLNANGRTEYRSGCGMLSCYGLIRKTTGDFTYIGKGNAKKIKGSVTWWLSGVNITVSIPAGVGFAPAGGGILWEPEVLDDEWREVLDHPAQVQLNATVPWTGYFTAQADFRLGSTWHHVQGTWRDSPPGRATI